MTIGMLPEPPEPAGLRRASPGTRGILLAALALVVVAGTLVAWYRSVQVTEPTASAQALATDTTARAPAGVRIRVRVLNTTSTKGLAKRATSALRDFGYDVVDYDSDTRAPRSRTLILSHTSHADWADRLRRALGTGAVEARADTLRYVDFTVLLGSDWKAPAQAFRP